MPIPCSPAPTVSDLEAAARRWVGTPTRHLGVLPGPALKGVAVDCINLAAACGLELGLVDFAGQAFSYGRLPNPKRLVEGLDSFLERDAPGELIPGRIVALAWNSRGLAMHVAILASLEGRVTMIHAHPAAKPAGRVVETGFAGVWPQRVCGVWRFAGLA